MGNTYGRRVLSQTIGRSIGISADGSPEYKTGGVTIDWSTVAAVSGADVALEDGIVVPIGKKYLRYGQGLQKITATGKYGPHDPAAAGTGRETAPARGAFYLLERTVLEDDDDSDFVPGGVIEGGKVFKARLRAHATTANLANGPTFAQLEAALPRITYAEQ